MTAARVLAGLTAAGLWGCASLTTLGSARTLAPGDSQVTVDAKFPLPVLEVGARYGVRDGLELGGRVGGFYVKQVQGFDAALDAKWQLKRSANPATGWDIALDPGVEYQNSESSRMPYLNSMDVSLPLLIGRNFGENKQLVFGPRVIGVVLWDPNSTPVPLVIAALSCGFIWRVRRFLFAVEGTVFLAPGSNVNTTGPPGAAQIGLGVAYGP